MVRREGAAQRLAGSCTVLQDGAALSDGSVRTFNNAKVLKAAQLLDAGTTAGAAEPRLLSFASPRSGCGGRPLVCCQPHTSRKEVCVCVWAGAHLLFVGRLPCPDWSFHLLVLGMP